MKFRENNQISKQIPRTVCKDSLTIAQGREFHNENVGADHLNINTLHSLKNFWQLVTKHIPWHCLGTQNFTSQIISQLTFTETTYVCLPQAREYIYPLPYPISKS